MNLNPLVEWDGYFVLMDFLGIPCLRKRSLYFIQKTIWEKLVKRESFSNEEKLYTGFGLLSAIWSVLAVIFAIQFWQDHLRHLFS